VADAGATSKSILVVDDDPVVRHVWTETLTRSGYGVLPASHGREALAHLRAVVPDLIVLDLRMPEMSGSEFLKALVGTTVPVLVVSGFLDEHAEALRAIPFNVVGHLAKPVALADLARAVAAALAPAARS
jgi:CheY-like chemotaxis protein